MSKNFIVNEHFDESSERIEMLISYLIINKIEKDLTSMIRSGDD